MFGFIFTIAAIILQVNSGLITHSDDGHHKATSYQSFDMEHFHAVPTHIKKDYKHLLEHPIPVGKSSTSIKVQHGDKHDYGYAIVDLENTLNAKEEPSTHENQNENVKYVYYAQPSVNAKEEEQSSYAQQSANDKEEEQSSYTNYEEPKSEKLVAQAEEEDASHNNQDYQVYQHAQTLHHYALAQSAQAETSHEPAPVALALHGVNYAQDDSQLGHGYYQSAPQKQYEYYQNQDQSQSEHNSS